MRKTGIVIFLVALFVSAAAILCAAEVKRQRDNRRQRVQDAAAYNDEIRDLWQEKRDLEREIREIEQGSTASGNNRGAVVLLFAEPDLRLEEDVFPLLSEYGYTGVIALSLNDFDDDAQRLSDDRLKELQSQGWEICLSLGSSEDLAALCRAVRKTDLDMPQTLYLPETLLTESQSAIAQAEGITTVVQHSGTVSGEICYSLPCIMATGSHESLISEEKKGLSKQLMLEAIEKSGGIVLTIGYNRVRDTFEENNVSAMLRSIDRYVKADKLAVTGCVNAWAQMSETTISAEDLERMNRERLAELRQRLAEVDAQVVELAK